MSLLQVAKLYEQSLHVFLFCVWHVVRYLFVVFRNVKRDMKATEVIKKAKKVR